MSKSILRKVGRLLAGKFMEKRQARHTHKPASGEFFSVNLVSSWDTKCGIATYSAFLAGELKKTLKVYITRLPKKMSLSPYFLVLGYKVGRSQDIVHIQFEYGLFSSLKLGKKKLTAFASLPFYLGLALGNRRVITTIHEPRRTISANLKSGLVYTKLLDKLMFSVSDRIIVHNRESKDLMKSLYAISESKLSVIPHGSFESPKVLDKEECKRRLGLQGKTVMTILGFISPKKGADLVIPLIKEIESKVQLVIAGGPQTVTDAKFVEELKKLVDQHQCSDRVTFTGYLPDLVPILNATDIAILPYRSVTDSGVLHILISYRLPIIASDLNAFREINQDYCCLELFKSENPQDLLRKIQAVLSDGNLRQSLSAKCELMWNSTKWSTIAKKHVEIYRETLFHLDSAEGL